MLLFIDAPHFSAAYDMKTGNIAPIIRYMKDWDLGRIMGYCQKKGWKCWH